MGYPYYELVPVAILLDNPGITKEEFIELLDQTHASTFAEYKENPRWDYYVKKYDEIRHHEGLAGLAEILNLKLTKKFKEFQKPKKDDNGLYIKAPEFWNEIISEHLLGEEGGRKPHVVMHTKNIVGKPKKVNEIAWEKLKPGDVWTECQIGERRGLVEKIIKEKELRGKDDDDDFYGPEYEYVMTIRPLEKEYERQKFESMEELLKKWPQFHPEFKYSFRQRKGEFSMAKNFIWEQKKGKYYLSKETYDKIPAGTHVILKGYTDLIITAEAVKKKAWKLVSYRGLQHLPKFLKDFPDSYERYKKAVIDGELSTFAKKRGMTITEYLRMRLEKSLPP